MAEQPIPIVSEAGVQRDGTRLAARAYVDALWCRFQRGLPKKIGGYQQVTDTVPEITRGMHQFSEDNTQYLHLGHPNTLGQYRVSNGTSGAFFDRTPAGFVTDVNNLWQFTIFADTAGTGNHVLVAHAAPNALDIDNSTGGNIYIGTVTDSAVLSTTGLNADVTVGWNTGTFGPPTGGVLITGQYLFSYGSRGRITQSQPNDLSALPVEYNVGTEKIVIGKALRGSGTGPAALFWSLNQIIRATFSGGATDFAIDVIDDSISIMSSQAVVETDGVFYWPGIDRWYMFNGVVREMPNTYNDNWFFDNLNYTHRNKVFGVKIPRFGEIWWCYPRGSATECTHAVIYNYRENFWFDTPLPDQDGVDQGRTAAVNAETYRRPFMVDNEVTARSGSTRPSSTRSARRRAPPSVRSSRRTRSRCWSKVRPTRCGAHASSPTSYRPARCP